MAQPLETYCTGPPEEVSNAHTFLLEALDLQNILLPPFSP